MTKTITAHTMVKNEDRFVWFSVMSVIDHVDKVLLWDTGSIDGTVEILKEIKRLKGNEEFTNVRKEMLESTKTDWMFMLDADEVWWEDSIRSVTDFIRTDGDSFESIVVPTINFVGDIFHRQEERAGNYHLAGRVGHLNLRGVSMKIPGLSSDKPHGTWGWADGNGRMIQDRNQKKMKYINAAYMHATFLQRSGLVLGDIRVPKRAKKRKHEIGVSFPYDYFYPEVFFRHTPSFVKSPWQTMDPVFRRRAYIETPLRKLKRRILPSSIGY